jgi:hypothetical protein
MNQTQATHAQTKQATTQDKPTGREELDAWGTLSEAGGDDAASVHTGLGYAAIFLVELAESCDAGAHFGSEDTPAARLMMDACKRAVAVIDQTLTQCEAK